MGQILDFIDKNNSGDFHCYRTRKLSLDDTMGEQFTHESYDRDSMSKDTSGKKYAETDTTNISSVEIPQKLIQSPFSNNIKYFLDGSRHTFKVDDISIGQKIYPIIAGQIIVGCCYRPDRDSFKKADLKKEIIISLPKTFYQGHWGKRDDYARKYAADLTNYLQENNKYAKEKKMTIGRVVFYEVDGPTVSDSNDKNRFMNSGIAQIQNSMTDEEQIMVESLCKQKRLSDSAYLIKDGSIQYNPRYSLLAKSDQARWDNMRTNYQHVIGISKSFDPTLLKDKNSNIAREIADLKPFHRTKVYLYCSEQSNKQSFGVWYLRLRNSDFRQTNFSDIVKWELLMLDNEKTFDTNQINWLCANIIREAYPVCFGADTRWANHLYPVYLTESFCKTQYIDKNIFLGLF